jgi:hypothetical protein
MTISRLLGRYALSICAATIVLAACGESQSQPSVGAPGITLQRLAVAPARAFAHRAGTWSYQVLYSFAGGSDGQNPRRA